MKRHCLRLATAFIFYTSLALISHAGGWSWPLPPDLVTPDSGKRNNVFYVGEPVTFKLGGAARRFEVRDYYGNRLDGGPTDAVIHPKITAPGWYKVYIYGAETRTNWANVVGGTTFCIFRNNTNFPALPDKQAPGGFASPTVDEVMRGIIGMGPQRHSVRDASKPEEEIAKLEKDIALDKQYYLPFDPLRKRVLMIAFPNGTKDLTGVRRIVEHFQNEVQYWEPRNEPNGGSSGADFAIKEMKPFYDTVKSVNPKLKVLGPGTVSVGPQLLPWIEDFLKAGGANSIDAFSFHAYNTVNGDVWLARKSLDALNSLLVKYGADKLEKWQTEQGYFAAMYGSYQPAHQGRWTMVQMMVYEQYGIPKEHNHLWYDKSHGFWDFPTWWENDDGGLNPAAPLMRIWSEELFGTQFKRAFDFGPIGNRLYIGSLFTGPGKTVAAFMSAGSTDGEIKLRVSTGNQLHVVSAFGAERDVPINNGTATLPVPELPVYVELKPDQHIEIELPDWGPNLARQQGVTVSASGTSNVSQEKTHNNDINKLINGDLENWYYSQKDGDHPWRCNATNYPAWVELHLPTPQEIGRVIIFAAPPWQSQSSLLDYELQYERDGKWVMLQHVQEPAQTFKVFTPPTRTSVDSFHSERWIFQHHFPPVVTAKIRLLMHDATWGGGATRDVVDAGGQTGPHQITLREIELYGR